MLCGGAKEWSGTYNSSQICNVNFSIKPRNRWNPSCGQSDALFRSEIFPKNNPKISEITFSMWNFKYILSWFTFVQNISTMFYSDNYPEICVIIFLLLFWPTVLDTQLTKQKKTKNIHTIYAYCTSVIFCLTLSKVKSSVPRI